MKVYVGREDKVYLIARKPFSPCPNAPGMIETNDPDGEAVVCPAVWHRLGGTRLKPGESCRIALTLVIKPISKKGHS